MVTSRQNSIDRVCLVRQRPEYSGWRWQRSSSDRPRRIRWRRHRACSSRRCADGQHRQRGPLAPSRAIGAWATATPTPREFLVVRKQAVVRGPERANRSGNPTDQARGPSTPHARAAVRAWRESPRVHQGTRQHMPRSTSRRRRHGRDARRFDRSGLWPKRHRPSRSAPHEEGRRLRCWPPSRPRSVQISAPRGPSRRWEENSAAAGASRTTSSIAPNNHAGSPLSRSDSRRLHWDHRASNAKPFDAGQ